MGISRLRTLDLFSGIGLKSDALKPWCRTVAYCEIEEKSRRVLFSRMARGEIDRAPCWDDVFTLSKGHLQELNIEAIAAGFPCTEISFAGLRQGLRAERSGLFFEVVRLAYKIRPAFIFLENVWPGVRKFVPEIRASFEGMGFIIHDGHLAARDIGLPHKRDRWFAVAYSEQNAIRLERGRCRGAPRQCPAFPFGSVETGKTSYIEKERLAHGWDEKREQSQIPSLKLLLEDDNWDELASELLRIDLGNPLRNYRIGALGDSVPPAQVRKAIGILGGFFK